MDINLDLYKIFYTVAKHKHMTKASEELHISQPAISQSIKKLEDQLGGTLFIRSNKGMELTSEGEMFFEHIKGALSFVRSKLRLYQADFSGRSYKKTLAYLLDTQVFFNCKNLKAFQSVLL